MMQEQEPVLIASDDGAIVGSRITTGPMSATDRRMAEWLRLRRRERRLLYELGDVRNEIAALDQMLASAERV